MSYLLASLKNIENPVFPYTIVSDCLQQMVILGLALDDIPAEVKSGDLQQIL